jgi:hypothetical protein
MAVSATDLTVTSPNGNIVVTVSDNEGMPSYRVNLNNVAFLNNSPLGLVTDYGDFTKQMTLNADAKSNTISEISSEDLLITVKSNRGRLLVKYAEDSVARIIPLYYKTEE